MWNKLNKEKKEGKIQYKTNFVKIIHAEDLLYDDPSGTLCEVPAAFNYIYNNPNKYKTPSAHNTIIKKEKTLMNVDDDDAKGNDDDDDDDDDGTLDKPANMNLFSSLCFSILHLSG